MSRLFLLIGFFFLGFSGFSQTRVLVSIAPQKYLVEEIGGERVSVEIIVPAGASSHTYEPTAKQVVSMCTGEIWFRLGEGFEERLIKALPHTQIVDQREGIDLLAAGCGCCLSGGADPHIWLSPRLLIIMAHQIADSLSERDPSHADIYRKNLKRLEKRLAELDLEMAAILREAPKTLLVSHPAYGYLCRDYGLTQLPIEMEGREPTPRYLTELILKARALKLQTLFLQRQHSIKGGMRVAKELGAKSLFLDPYAENVIDNLREIAKAFRQ
ncbi:MAG: zinc ABC transporter substrate-binding protein [Chlamydiales bacterium]|nr:zinc ABC transporter substrate-binding protein [Chlamydiales bacterium]